MSILFRTLPLLLCLIFLTVSSAQDSSPSEPEIVLVVGAAGAPEYGQQFEQWSEQWTAVAEKASAKLTQIAGANDSRERLEKVIKDLSPTGEHPVWLVLLGHGTFSGNVAKFNLAGPDVSAKDLAAWLKPIQRPVVVVNCSASSAPFINQLSANNRVIVTATRSGGEHNFARFGKHFAEAIASAESDLDHDDEVSVHEAFVRASAEVQRFYDAEARLMTEHALIDDNGDSRGTPATMFRGSKTIAQAKEGSVDGKLSRRISLATTGNVLSLTDDELKQRTGLENQIEQLRGKKETLTTEQYDAQLHPLMLALAKIYAAAEARQDAAK